MSDSPPEAGAAGDESGPAGASQGRSATGLGSELRPKLGAGDSPGAPASPSGQEPRVPPPPRWAQLALPLVMLALLWVWYTVSQHAPAADSVSYTVFYSLVEAGKLESVTLRGRSVEAKLKEAAEVDHRHLERFRTTLPAQEDSSLLPLLRSKGVDVEVASEDGSVLTNILSMLLPWALIIGVWMWLSRRAQKLMLGAGASPFGGMMKSRAKRFEKATAISVRFDDVAGLDSAKRDLQEIVDFLKEPQRFRRLGAKVPRGVLLVGPPGTGKTLLARAVAGEAQVPFFSINGSEFIELFVGVGASRVRELFDNAKKESPAIIFIDEIDAVGRSRGAGLGGGHDEREQTLNQMLSEMDGFSSQENVVVLAATNRPDVLDAALLRPGRFDRHVVLDRPERRARLAILHVHTRSKPLAPDIDLEALAADTPGFSGADLANLVNEAVLSATRRGADRVEREDFTKAYEKVVLGERRETVLSPAEKQRVALHEAGHAVVAHFAPHAEPLRRVTIIPHGMALGATQQSPLEDRHLATHEELDARLQVLLGGYAAEKLSTGDVSTGAENDLKTATELASKMVSHYGMSDKIGPVYHEHHTEHPFLGQRLATESGLSDETIHLIEQEARALLLAAERAAEALLLARRPAFERLVAALCEYETVEKEGLIEILGPATQGPATQGPATHDPATQGPATQGPATQGPAAQGPATHDPATHDPATHDPATQGPATHDPATQGPATQGPLTPPSSRST